MRIGPWIAPALLVLAGCVCAAPTAPAGMKQVATDLCGVKGRNPHTIGADSYRFTEAALPVSVLPAGDPLRSCGFAETVRLRWSGLDPAASYAVTLTFVTDSDLRLQQVVTGTTVLDPGVRLSRVKVVERTYTVPAAAFDNGSLEIGVRRLEGPNAVVSAATLWSTRPDLLPYLEVVEPCGDLRGNLVGAVRHSNGKPARDAVVLAVDRAGTRRTRTDDQGRFVIPWTSTAAPGAVRITAELGAAKGLATVAGGDITRRAPRLTPPIVQVRGVAERPVDLGGTWGFLGELPADFARNTRARLPWKPIRVPGEWAMQGFTVGPNAWAGYRRRFVVPAGWNGDRVRLRFDSVYSECRVFVNGKEAGTHLGAFIPFELDITPYVRFGTENRLALAVRGDSVADQMASGSQYAAHPLGGIQRGVRLFRAPGLSVSGLHVATEPVAGGRNWRLKVEAEISNQGGRAPADWRLSYRLVDAQGRSRSLVPDATGGVAGEPGQVDAVLVVPEPLTWDPEHPRLYRLQCDLVSGGRSLMRVERRFGFRQVVVKGSRVLVNGRPIKLHGLCRHEVDPLTGRSLPAGTHRRDIALFRGMNANFIRTSHYPPDEALLEAADELGMFVEVEAPFCWAPGSNPGRRDYTVDAALAMVQRDRSHPSVLMWSVANESEWGSNFAASAAAIHTLDPTRPRIFSYGEVDIASWHYPGPGGPARAAASLKPILFDEYCHLNCYNRRELTTDPGVRDAYGALLERMWSGMRKSPGCLGGSIWAGIDDSFFMPDGRTVGYGSWGPIDGWRRQKPEYWHVKKVYSPVRVQARSVPAGRVLRIPVENRHLFTDLSELTVRWAAGGQSGQVRPGQAQPGAIGCVAVRPARLVAPGSVLEVAFVNGLGEVVDRETVTVGSPRRVAITSQPGSGDVVEDGDVIRLTGGGSAVELDRATGQLRSAACGQRRTTLSGPRLTLVPLNGEGGTQVNARDLRFEPVLGVCRDWRCLSVRVERGEGSAEVVVSGEYAEAAGEWRLSMDSAGRLRVGWRFVLRSALEPRQIGVSFGLPDGFERLAWERDGAWSCYPADHIGRARGSAYARTGSHPVGPVGPATRPGWAWAHDANELGSNDFRSSKESVTRASLSDGQVSVTLLPLVPTAVRCWLGDGVNLGAFTYWNAGGESFLGAHVEARKLHLVAGDEVKGECRLAVEGR